MEVEITNVLFLWFLICGPGMTMGCYDLFAGLLSVGVPGVPGVPGQTQILADQLTLFQPGGDKLCPPNYYWHTRIFRPSEGPGMDDH